MALIEAGEACVLGDDGECQVYEAKVKKAPSCAPRPPLAALRPGGPARPRASTV